MTFSEEQIEWIVMEVLRRLGVAADRAPATAPGGGELRLDDRVVTLRSIESRLSGISRVVVLPRAVVTPAVRDELKVRKIELIFGGRNANQH